MSLVNDSIGLLEVVRLICEPCRPWAEPALAFARHPVITGVVSLLAVGTKVKRMRDKYQSTPDRVTLRSDYFKRGNDD